ncbi:MAG TPA: NUDIX domain-containing protein [Chlamydiales bacterium]|nr:NUDIX domain-containing protein [Chlamydiales bacterium]
MAKISTLFLMVKSVAGIIFSPDRSSVLLIQRRDVPVWVLPGGGIEPSETSENAILREILEETGFTTRILRLVGAYTPINRLAKSTHLYECVILSGAAASSSETKKVQFFPLISLPKLIPPPYPDWIADSLLPGPPLHKKLTSVTYATLLRNLFLHPLLVFRFLLARLGWAINT